MPVRRSLLLVVEELQPGRNVAPRTEICKRLTRKVILPLNEERGKDAGKRCTGLGV